MFNIKDYKEDEYSILKLEEGKLYKTLWGEKAFISKKENELFLGVIVGDSTIISWNKDGVACHFDCDDNIISEWED